MKSIEIAGKILGTFLGLGYLLLFEGNEWYQWICFVAILISIGIPHGAIDHLLLNPAIEKNNLVRFILKYLAIIGIYLGVWLIFPILALSAFVSMSAYHFGQSHFIKLRLQKLEKLTYFSLGSFFLSTIFWADFGYTTSILSNIIEVTQFGIYGFWIIGSTFASSTILILVNLKAKGLLLLLEISLLGIFLYQLPLLLGFIIYFGFWHSLPSMAEEFKALEDNLKPQKIKNFILKLLPFTLISLMGIFLILMFFQNLMKEDQLTLLFFIMVSLISAPHIWYINLFLERRKSQY
jgi:Brp/Blh family beta-carotene 15,15'-monooxygenase